jgi:uncharacterized repeat protein (TIGR01451 family)
MRLARIVVGTLVAFVFVAAPQAGSAAVPLGQTDTAGGIVCMSGLEVDVQRATDAATQGYAAPAAGVITQWADAGNGTSTGHVKLKVYRPPSSSISNTFTVVGEGATEPIPVTKSTTSFPVRIPVRAGDVLGLLTVDGNPSCVFGSPSTSDLVNDEFPGTDDPPGSTTTAGTRIANERVNVSARLEADADSDAFGDESQDACPGLPGSVAGCPRADLALGESAGHGGESDLVTYTLLSRNNGPDAVADVAVSDTLPAGATLISSTGPQGPCSASGRSVSCSVGPLSSGAAATVTLTARLTAGNGQVDAATTSSAALASAATKAGGAGDPNPADDVASASVDVSGPAVSSARAVPSRFRLGSLLPRLSRRPPVGTTISFGLSEPARATLTFAQPKTGRKVRGRCRSLTRANRRKPKCTIPNVRGVLLLAGHAGTNRLRFQGRLTRTRRLGPGTYTLTITATDSAGNRSRPRTIRFTIVR